MFFNNLFAVSTSTRVNCGGKALQIYFFNHDFAHVPVILMTTLLEYLTIYLST